MADITVYSKPDCIACDRTYKALDEKGVEYDVVDITEDDDALAFILSLGYKAAPVVVTPDDHWAQFRKAKIDAL